MKKIFIIMISLLCLAVPAFAASTTVEAVSVDLSPKGNFTSKFDFSDVIDIEDGIYSLNIVGTGLGVPDYLLRVFVTEWDPTGTFFVQQWGTFAGRFAGQNDINISNLFRVTDSVNRLFTLDVHAEVPSPGQLSFTASIERVTLPVPGPEAGAGVGALAMAGVAYLTMRRRRTLAA